MNRVFISLGGRCKYACHHCYTHMPEYKLSPDIPIIELVENSNLSEETDIVYISGHRENFIDPFEGLALCDAVYEKAKCDILITTRSAFDIQHIHKLVLLADKMRKNGHYFFFCASIPALESFRLIESSDLIPSPEKRMKSLKMIYDTGIVYTILTIRPLFHNSYLSVNEPIEIIEKCADFSDAVLSSGFVANEFLFDKMNYPKNEKMFESDLMPCLGQKNMKVYYCDVNNELDILEAACKKQKVPFFSTNHTGDSDSVSLECVNFLKESNQINKNNNDIMLDEHILNRHLEPLYSIGLTKKSSA